MSGQSYTETLSLQLEDRGGYVSEATARHGECTVRVSIRTICINAGCQKSKHGIIMVIHLTSIDCGSTKIHQYFRQQLRKSTHAMLLGLTHTGNPRLQKHLVFSSATPKQA